MKTSETFYGNYISGKKKFDGFPKGVSVRELVPLSIKKFKRWPAGRTGIWFGVKTAVCRVFVFPLAQRTHRETGHGRIYPVIRDILDNRQPGAAVCAVDKGIAESSIGGVKKFLQTVVAGGDVRRNMNLPGASGIALNNPECLIVIDFYLFCRNSRNVGKRRKLFLHAGHEGVDGVRRAFHLDKDPIRAILNET
jgi:hypothetical protein